MKIHFFRVMASETKAGPPGSLVEGFDCADDGIVPLRWAPDCCHRSAHEYVRAVHL